MTATSQQSTPPSPQPPTCAREKFRFDHCDEEDRSARREPWEIVVRLRDKNRRQAVKYLSDRDGTICTISGHPLDIAVLYDGFRVNIDHLDGHEENNRKWNIRLACPPCNNALYQQQKRQATLQIMPSQGVSEYERVRERLAGAEKRVRWSAHEPESSREMNCKFDEWIADAEKGPFVHRDGERIEYVAVGYYHLANMACALMRQEFNTGSQATMCRYIDARSVAPYPDQLPKLKVYPSKRTGKLMVRPWKFQRVRDDEFLEEEE